MSHQSHQLRTADLISQIRRRLLDSKKANPEMRNFELAERFGVSPSTVVRWLRAERTAA